MATFIPDTDNELFQLAIQLVNFSNRSLFLTGKAGTGKTTFLKYIREHSPKQMAIVAPTGVAAINAGGVTIHSFFQLPLTPFIPDSSGTGFSSPSQEVADKHSLLSRLRFTSDKKKVLQQLELLVIDEISMVRCDTLDAIDAVLRFIRQRPADKFGGVQVLFIGDLLQLPPVIKEPEWQLLSDYYQGHYFFDSKVLQEEPPLYIEFDKIYRQKDNRFIDVLNQVRNNQLNESGIEILKSRYQPTFRRRKNDGYIVLTTHNNKATEINRQELEKLRTPLYSYPAEVEDDFSDRAYPAEELLYLKVGAQVMFIRNDSAEKGKRYFNGKIGIVTTLEEDKIVVRCDSDSFAANESTYEIEVQKEKWENIRYTMDKSTRQLETDVLGSFTQYPLRLAWAITIHKSQGLTFEKAIIDAGAAFAPGQVYVALSRCTCLEGVVLQSQIGAGNLFSDPRIVTFAKRNSSGEQLQQELVRAKKQYQLFILQQCFDISIIEKNSKELLEYLVEHTTSFNKEAVTSIEIIVAAAEQLQETAVKFQTQLNYLFQETDSIDSSTNIKDRIRAAGQYFIPLLKQLLNQLQQAVVVTDSRIHAKECNDRYREVAVLLAEKNFLLTGIAENFSIENYFTKKNTFRSPSLSFNAYAGGTQHKTDSPHPLLYQELKKLRESICSKKNLPIYMVAGSSTLEEMVRYLPQNMTALKKINGFGEVKAKQYGQLFLDLIIAYTNEHNLYTQIDEKPVIKQKSKKTVTTKKKTDTYAESLALFEKGNSITEIAEIRSLTMGTIENHLLRYIRSGEIEISKIIAAEKINQIQQVLDNNPSQKITAIKELLGENISFGEIRFVVAANERIK